MVIDLNENGNVTSVNGRSQGGVCCFGSWSNVAQSLVRAGWGGNLKDDEYVKQLIVGDDGITIVIGWKGER